MVNTTRVKVPKYLKPKISNLSRRFDSERDALTYVALMSEPYQNKRYVIEAFTQKELLTALRQL